MQQGRIGYCAVGWSRVSFYMEERLMDTLEERIAEIETDLLPGLLEYPQIGWTDATEKLINMIRPTIIEAGRSDLLEKVQKVEEWLVKARAEEAVHGKDCLFNIDHPSIQESISRITAGGWKMTLPAGSRRPYFQ
jgi:hypothetical protein